MAIMVSIEEAQAHLARLLQSVGKGEHVVITRQGVPIAEISPIDTVTINERREAITKLKQFRNGKHAGGSIKAMIEKGRM